MKRLLSALAVVGVAGAAWAEPPPRLPTGGIHPEAAGAISAGSDAVGIAGWLEREDLHRTAGASFDFRRLSLITSTEKDKPLVTRPNVGVFFRDLDSAQLQLRGGTALQVGKAFGLGLRAGSAGGGFSVVATPSVGFDGAWVIREGWSGFSGRFPLGAELGAELRPGRLFAFAIARAYADVWFNRPTAYRFSGLVGLGWSFDLPAKRKKGEPAPPGP